MTKRIYFICLFLSFSVITTAQEVFFADNFRNIYRVDLGTCTSTLVTPIRGLPRGEVIKDITFTPDGKFYAIGTQLYEVNLTTGVATAVIPNTFQLENAMVADNNGVIYLAGGFSLSRVDLRTRTLTYVGVLPRQSAGDLTFRNGKLYLSAINNALYEVNLRRPDSSILYMTMNIPNNQAVFGIVSFASACDSLRTFAVTASSGVYEIDFNSRTVSATCSNRILQTSQAFGGASRLEFRGSGSLVIDSLSISQTACDQGIGRIGVNTSGGVGGSLYSLNGGAFQRNNVFANLGAGDYRVTVRDSLGCRSLDTTVRLGGTNVPTITTVNVQPIICGRGGTGTIAVAAQSPVSSVQYRLNNQPFSNTNTFTNLSAGNYNITVKDDSGCVATWRGTIDSIPKPRIVNIDVTQTRCNQNNGALNIKASNDEKARLFYSLDGLSFRSDSIFVGLRDSTYRVTVRDSFGCATTQTAQILFSSGVKITDYKIVSTKCGNANGSLAATAELVRGNPNIAPQISLIPLPPSTQPVLSNFVGDFRNLKSGEYLLKAADQKGCADSVKIRILPSESIKITDILTNPSLCDAATGSIYAKVKGNNGRVSYSLDNRIFTSDSSFRQLGPNVYAVFVRDTQGCTAQTDAFFLSPECIVFAPNAFSPNGDGNNDAFTIFSSNDWVENIAQLEIFNRWGDRVFAAQNMPVNDVKLGWNGSFQGSPCNPDVFVYSAQLRMRNGKILTIKGDVTLLR
ncbi:MAG: hypothetical protein RL757_878 [Bacteroidota bacterium]|jgi:gliding motility-associated-like protein